MQRVRQRRDWAEGREVVPVEDDVGHYGSRAGNHLTPFPCVVCWCMPLAEMPGPSELCCECTATPLSFLD